MSRNMARKIRELRRRLDMNQSELARAIGGVDQATVSKWERGLQSPNAQRTARLAELAGESYGNWLGVRPLESADAQSRTYNVVGELMAGAWREAIEWAPDDQYTVAVPVAPGMPDIPLRGYVVRGPSMNKLYPDGALVFVAATIANGLTPKSGQRVLVQRRNRDGLYEATLKEYVEDSTGRWLWPRSYDPEHQAPLQVGKNGEEEVTITGIVMASFINEALR